MPANKLPLSYLCPTCNRRSYHPKDIEERFCGVCGFADALPDTTKNVRLAEPLAKDVNSV